MNTRQLTSVALTVVSALVLLTVVAPAVAAQAPGDGSIGIDTERTITETETTDRTVNLSIRPATAETDPGAVTTYEVVLSGALDGLEGYSDLELVIGSPSVAQFVDFTETPNHGPAQFSQSEIRDGSGNQASQGPVLSLSAGLGRNTIQGAKEIVIAEADIEATGDVGSESPINISDSPEPEVQDVNSTQYQTGTLEDASLDITNPAVNISVEPAAVETDPGTVTTYEVVLSGAIDGLEGYSNLELVIGSPSVAQFVDFTETPNHGQPGSSQSEIRDGSGNQANQGPVLSLSAALGNNTIGGAQEIVIAEADIEATGGAGDGTPITITDNPPEVQDLDSAQYEIETLEDASLNIVDQGINISIEPATVESGQGAVTTYEVVLSGALDGLEGYSSLELVVEKPSVAQFVGFTETPNHGPAQFSGSEIRDGSGNSASQGPVLSLTAALGDNTIDGAEEIVIAEADIEATGDAGNETSVTVTDSPEPELRDLDSTSYTVGSLSGSTLEIVAGVDVNGNGKLATDTTGNGLWNDVNGDGAFNIFDVQTLFDHLGSDAVQNNPGKFNFDGRENPTQVNIFDVQALFGQF